MKRIRNAALILTLLVTVSLISFRVGQNSVSANLSDKNQLNLSLMWKVKDKLSQLYLEKDKMDKKTMEYGAISGMVASLGDPYTVFLPPTDNKASREDLAGEFGGVGISLGYKDRTLAVMSPLPKTPAEKSGVVAGDLILKIIDKEKNIDKDTTGIALDEAVSLIRGKVGTEVTLKMYREGRDGTFDVTLKRENIVVPSLELEWLDDSNTKGKKVAWVKLYKFTERLDTEWQAAIDQINNVKKNESQKYGGIVLDLRNNPGGFLQGSVMVASDFLKEGVVVKQESTDGRTEVYEVDKLRKNLLDDNMVVLVNGGSASASEILAGALREYDRVQLVGEKTFGKGIVQQPEEFSDGSGLHITIAKWLLPSGKNIHKEGVDPDIEVKLDNEVEGDEQLNKATEVLLEKY